MAVKLEIKMANAKDKEESGWTFDYDFLSALEMAIHNEVPNPYNGDWEMQTESIEAVLIVLKSRGLLVMPEDSDGS